jgi:hypothetical protein
VVVKITNRMRQGAGRTRSSLPCVTVLLAGISILPTQSDGISLMPAGAQLHAIEQLRTGLQTRAIKPLSYLEFVPPQGQLDPSLTFSFNWSDAGLGQTQGSDPAVTALLNSTVSTTPEEFGVGGGSAPTAREGAPTWTRIACEQLAEQLPDQLQTGGERWNTNSAASPPVQLAANIPAYSIQGPTGYLSNLPSQGPVGAWCRPGPLPFASSGPLANRAFWTPIAVVLFGAAVLWLSRGVKLPS